MTEKELFEKNLELNHEFSKYLLEHPEVEDKIPTDALIVFVVEDDPELSKRNLEMSRAREPGQRIVIVHIKGLRPPEGSRLVQPQLEFAS